ncbi:MAG: pantetheine-phosphate adenylyltransferase [Clostridia bacterium]|nr:pantetheine-phosphate adenylyltransferase [Clostridia bacterium]
MKVAICPGSFDPVTCGHVDIITRAAAMFDKVIVVVMVNSNKQPLFTQEERVELLKRATASLPNVEVDAYSGMLAEYAHQKQATAVVKGLRAVSDFEYEFQMALTNRKLNPQLETVFLTTNAEYLYLSSSLVKQMASLGGDIREFVPACIVNDILEKYGRNEET